MPEKKSLLAAIKRVKNRNENYNEKKSIKIIQKL